MRTLALILGSLGVVACNALVGWGDLQEVNEPTSPPGDASTNPTSEGGVTDDGASSGGPSGPRCDPSKPFGTPVAVASINTSAGESGATVSADELTVIFQRSNDTVHGAIFQAQRTSIAGSFEPATELTVLGAGQNGFWPSLDPSGLVLYWAQSVTTDQTQIYRASRISTGVQFSAGVVVSTLQSSFVDFAPYINADLSELYFASTRDSSVAHLFRSLRDASGTYQSPVEVGELRSGDGAETSIALSKDLLTAYFSSTRAGGLGGSDIWMVGRATPASIWSSPTLVPTVNTRDSEQVSAVSQDNCALYLTRGASVASSDVYVAIRGN